MGRHIYLRTAAIVVLLLLPPAQASSAGDSGLEIASHKRLEVIIEGLPDNSRQAGLTQDLIRAKVELQLRRNGISPIAKDEYKPGYLYVWVSTVDHAFHVEVQFKRTVTYSSEGRMYETFASVWGESYTGTFAGGSSYILLTLANLLDLFINAYLKANQE